MHILDGTNIFGTLFHFSDSWSRSELQNKIIYCNCCCSPPRLAQVNLQLVLSRSSKMLSPYSEVWVYLPFLQSCLCSRSFLGPSVCRFPIKVTSHHVTHWLFFTRNKFRAQMPLHAYLYIVGHKWPTSMIPYSLSSLCDNKADWILRQHALSVPRLASMDTAAKTITSI